MKILLDARSDNPEYNADCDYALVDLTPSLVVQIRRRMELARQMLQQDSDLYELYFWGGTADFYDQELVEACQTALAEAAQGTQEGEPAADAWLAELENHGHAQLPASVDLCRHEVQRVECCQMILRCPASLTGHDFEVAWTASPKHSDIYVQTADLPLVALEGYVHGETLLNKETLH